MQLSEILNAQNLKCTLGVLFALLFCRTSRSYIIKFVTASTSGRRATWYSVCVDGM